MEIMVSGLSKLNNTTHHIKLLPFIGSQICYDLLFSPLHILSNMGKEMSTLCTLIHIHTLIPLASPAYSSCKYTQPTSTIIHNQINTYLSKIFVQRKSFDSLFTFLLTKLLFWIQTFGLYMQKKISRRKLSYSNNTQECVQQHPLESKSST